MSLSHAYALTNLAGSLADSALTWSNGVTTNRALLHDGRMDKQMAVGGGTGHTLTIDLGSAQPVSFIAILNSNWHQATTPVMSGITGADNSGLSTNAVNTVTSTAVQQTRPAHRSHVFAFQATTKRYWGIGITYASTSGYTLKIGEVFIGLATALSRTREYPAADRELLTAARFESDTGDVQSCMRAPDRRQRILSFSDMLANERDELLLMHRSAMGSPLLWIETLDASLGVAANNGNCHYGYCLEDSINWTEVEYGRNAGLYTPSGLVIDELARGVGTR